MSVKAKTFEGFSVNELINYLKAYNFEIYARCNRTKFNGSDFQEDVLFKKK